MDEQLMSWATNMPEVTVDNVIHLRISANIIKVQKLQGIKQCLTQVAVFRRTGKREVGVRCTFGGTDDMDN